MPIRQMRMQICWHRQLHSWGTSAMWRVRLWAESLALEGIGGFTLGGLASFLTFNKSFNMPINQVSQQLNAIVMAMAGANRVFQMLDETPEADDGYVTLVNARRTAKGLEESGERTGIWAWKHVHQTDSSVDYVELKGDVVFDDVDFRL